MCLIHILTEMDIANTSCIQEHYRSCCDVAFNLERCIEKHYRSCWDVAFSSMGIILENIAVCMDNQQPVYSQITYRMPFFCLGKLCFTTISEGVKTFSNSVCRTMRQWSIDLMVHIVFNGMIILNPRLNKNQQHQLMSVISRAVEQLLFQHSFDDRIVKGIVTLVSPDRGSCLLLTYLIDVLRELACNDHAGMESKQFHIDLESAKPRGKGHVEEDGNTVRALSEEYGIQQIYVAAMPVMVRKAVLDALRSQAESSSNNSDFQVAKDISPICCITLEPLLYQNHKVSKDVVAVVQGAHKIGKKHAFLYRGNALYNWLGTPRLPRSPETRHVIKPMDIYRLS